MKRTQRYYAIKNTPDRSAEVLIYGEIRQPSFWDEYFGSSDAVSAKSFRRDLAEAVKDCDRVTVRINCMGGDIAEGNAIITALKNCGKPTTAIVDGVAYSMGAVIALSCDETLMPRNTLLMLHAPSTFEYGTAHDFRTTADTLDKYAATLAETISDRTKETPEAVVAKYMDNVDHYFTAREAMDTKLITGIQEYDSPAVPQVDNMRDGTKLKAWFESNPIVALESNDSGNWFKRAAALLTNKTKQSEPFTLKNLQTKLAAAKDGEPVTLSADEVKLAKAEVDAVTNGGKLLHTPEDLKAVQDKLDAAEATAKTEKDAAAASALKVTDLEQKVTELNAKLEITPGATHKEAKKTGDDNVDDSKDDDESLMTDTDKEAHRIFNQNKSTSKTK